jgi:hypothetical protein
MTGAPIKEYRHASNNGLLLKGLRSARSFFKDEKGDFANNVGRILSTVDSARQIQLGVRFFFRGKVGA